MTLDQYKINDHRCLPQLTLIINVRVWCVMIAAVTMLIGSQVSTPRRAPAREIFTTKESMNNLLLASLLGPGNMKGLIATRELQEIGDLGVFCMKCNSFPVNDGQQCCCTCIRWWVQTGPAGGEKWNICVDGTVRLQPPHEIVPLFHRVVGIRHIFNISQDGFALLLASDWSRRFCPPMRSWVDNSWNLLPRATAPSSSSWRCLTRLSSDNSSSRVNTVCKESESEPVGGVSVETTVWHWSAGRPAALVVCCNSSDDTSNNNNNNHLTPLKYSLYQLMGVAHKLLMRWN